MMQGHTIHAYLCAVLESYHPDRRSASYRREWENLPRQVLLQLATLREEGFIAEPFQSDAAATGTDLNTDSELEITVPFISGKIKTAAQLLDRMEQCLQPRFPAPGHALQRFPGRLELTALKGLGTVSLVVLPMEGLGSPNGLRDHLDYIRHLAPVWKDALRLLRIWNLGHPPARSHRKWEQLAIGATGMQPGSTLDEVLLQLLDSPKARGNKLSLFRNLLQKHKLNQLHEELPPNPKYPRP